MNCKKIKIIISAYLDGYAAQTDKALLEKHLHDCAGCRKEYNELKNSKYILAALDKQHAPAGFESKVIEKIKNNTFTANPLESFIAAAKTTLAACVMLFGVIAAFSFFTPSVTPANRDNVEAINNYVLKENIFAKQDQISDAKIIEALLG